MKNIYIIGGGTAGWLTAIFLSKFHSKSNVTLVESKSVGIVGVGEGTTPVIRRFFDRLGINEQDFQKNTNSTRKVGIHFKNWCGDDNFFNHDFYTTNSSNYAYHFDTYTLGEYFKNIAKERGINYIQDDVIDFKFKGENIHQIYLKDNGVVDTDFIFDCSGFSRLVLDKQMKSEWISVKQYLTLNSALPFYLPNDTPLFSNSNTRTDAITMKYGWLWRIPLQDRMGCGYVFDSNYVSDDDAKKEVEEYLGKSIDFKKRISFESGYFKEVWKGNCISIGLSGGFFEPLEATSIMTIIIQLEALYGKQLINDERDFYNTHIRNVNEQVLNFIKYHYVCDRNDTKFWQDYKTHDLPLKLQNLLDSNNRLKVLDENKLRKILEIPVIDNVFSVPSYLILSKGNFKRIKNQLF